MKPWLVPGQFIFWKSLPLQISDLFNYTLINSLDLALHGPFPLGTEFGNRILAEELMADVHSWLPNYVHIKGP